MEIKKIITEKGNVFVFTVDNENQPTTEPGYYATPEGVHIEIRVNAKNEVDWMQREWAKKPTIVDADVKVFGNLFDQSSGVRPAYAGNKEATSNPFAGLGALLKEKK